MITPADPYLEAFRELEAEFGYGSLRREFADRPYWSRHQVRRASSVTQRRG